jgi:hypothetical protein
VGEIRQERLVAAGLALAMAAAAALVLWEGRGLTFWSDEWEFLQYRRTFDPGVLLEPYGGHLELVPLLIDNALFATVGADSYFPYRLVAVALVLLCAGLFFLLARRRLGGPLALVPTVLLLFFGAAWEVFSSPNGIPTFSSIAAGLAALLALDRRDWHGNVLACLMLAVSLASLSVGIAFAVGIAVEVLRRPERERWRSSWIFLLPVSLYATWALWGLQFDDGQLRIENIGALPTSMADSMAAVVAAITGLFRVPAETGVGVPFRTDWGAVLAVPLVIVIVVRLWQAGGVSARGWAALAMTLALWASIAMVTSPARSPVESRYLYPGAVLLLLLIAELARGLTVSRRGLATAAGALAIALVGNIAQLHDGGIRLRMVSDVNRAELAGLELARGHVDFGFRPEGPGAIPPAKDNFLHRVVAGRYFSAIDDAGSPAYSLAELERRPDATRQAADIVLARALRLQVRPVARLRPGRSRAPIIDDPGGASVVRHRGCVELRPSGEGSSVALRVPPGGLGLQARPGPAVTVNLGRFADGFPMPLGALPGGSAGSMAIPLDDSGRPWRVLLTTRGQPIRACGVR